MNHWRSLSGLARRACATAFMVSGLGSIDAADALRAGAAVQDITPTQFPVLVNAMFTERTATNAVDPLSVRALALDDGRTQIVIAVVDTCMISRDLIDAAKEEASRTTHIPTRRMLVSATHTHSAPSAMGCLGSRQDTNYARILPGRIAAALIQAVLNLEPARIGWAVTDDWEHTHNRRWIRRPDRLLKDPFDQENVRAHMHPGYESPDAIGPSGPVDPGLSVLSVQASDGRPLALLANYSMHYYESPLLSSDYYGRFAAKIQAKLAPGASPKPFVALMSQGTSGDQMWMDYGAPKRVIGLDAYAQEVADRVLAACEHIEYRSDPTLAMEEATLPLSYRAPDNARLTWAREKAALLGNRLPQTLPEIYALEAIYLHERPATELKLQAIRIGDFGIAAIPNEVFALTGLKLKAQSPLQPLMNIELANGAEGYIPPPEQHRLGGYTTWPARTAGLETNAEPAIVERLLGLLESVSGKKRRALPQDAGAYVAAVQDAHPVAYWRLNEMAGPDAHSEVPGASSMTAQFEDGVAFYLPGAETGAPGKSVSAPPAVPNAFSGSSINRAAHFAGGRLRTTVSAPRDRYSVEFWFWNGLSNEIRSVTGYLFSRGPAGVTGAPGDHLGISGTLGHSGRLLFFNGNQLNQQLQGNAEIPPKTWHHVALARDGENVRVWLDGRLEIAGAPLVAEIPATAEFFFGGRSDRFANFEGKLDEISVYDRPLTAETVEAHWQAAQERRGDGKKSVVKASPRSGPMDAAQARRTLQTEPGTQVELVAAEPDVVDPVAVAFDERGRMYVVENRGYPVGSPDGVPQGRVALLEDLDGDGRFEKRTEFAGGFTFPNGILPWNGGVIVTCAPDILFLKDTDGDGRADVREVWFTGFDDKNTTQLRVSHPTLGPDGWVYLTSGWTGASSVSCPKHPERPAIRFGSDSRFNPVTLELEPLDGRAQFGHTFDDAGNRFTCFNRVHLQHVVLSAKALQRNPSLAFAETIQNVPENMFSDLIGGGHQNPAARLYPISDNITTADSHAGQFSAACGVMIYRTDGFSPDFYGSALACDPTGNLVHRDQMKTAGATFSSRMALEGRELLASTDNWFRPVNLATGPDGAIYVCDMYRRTIEHPLYLPEEVRKRSDFESGKGMGRIWRIFAENRKPAMRPPDLGKLPAAELVALVGHSNLWQRETAFRLLLERRPPEAIGLLRNVVLTSPTNANASVSGGRPPATPTTRALSVALALRLLDALSAADAALVRAGLQHEDALVRQHALALAPRFALASPEVRRAMVALAQDPAPRIRFLATLALGEAAVDERIPALLAVARLDGEDRWARAAVLSGLKGLARSFFDQMLSAGAPLPPPAFLQDLGRVLATEATAESLRTLGPSTFETMKAQGAPAFIAFWSGLADSARRLADERHQTLPQLLAWTSDESDALAEDARQIAVNPEAKVAFRRSAIILLRWGDEARARETCFRLLTPGEPSEVQYAAVAQIADTPGEAGATELLAPAHWGSYSSAVREVALNALIREARHLPVLLGALESGQLPLTAVPPVQRRQLRGIKDEALRTRVEKLFSSAGGNRMQVFEAHRGVLTLAASGERGRALFRTHCASCHRLEQEGANVGPDLFGIRNQSKETILLHVLVPNFEISPGFNAYEIETKAGRTLTGLIAAETPTSVTLRQPQGLEETLRRAEIARLQASSISLMPDELEKTMTRQELADLLAYVKGEK